MRLIRTAGSAVAALVVLGGLVPPASALPLEVEWRIDADLAGYDQALVVDPASGDVMALSQSGDTREVLRRLDARTGSVEWTVAVPSMTELVIDPTTGQVVLAGWRDSGQVLMFVAEDGRVVREVASDLPAYPHELAVDEVSGQVCTLGPLPRRREAVPTWYTACWTSAGDAVFVDQREVPSDRSIPSALAIDPETHRVYAAGTARPAGQPADRRPMVVVLAYDASGTFRWEARRRTDTPTGDVAIAVDSERRRIHVLNEPGRIQSPVSLVSFDTRGRTKFVRSWEDLGSVYESAVAVSDSGRVLAVATEVAHATLRVYSRSGRLVRSAVVRTAPNKRRAFHDQIVIDSRRERVHVLAGGGDTPSRVLTYDFRGKRLSSVVVDRRDVIEGNLAVDLRSGRVFVSTSRFQDVEQRVTALGR